MLTGQDGLALGRGLVQAVEKVQKERLSGRRIVGGDLNWWAVFGQESQIFPQFYS